MVLTDYPVEMKRQLKARESDHPGSMTTMKTVEGALPEVFRWRSFSHVPPARVNVDAPRCRGT
jgi:hypothetical protein